MAFSEVLQILITANGSQAVGEFQKVGASAKTNLGGAEKSASGFAAGFKKNAGLIAVGAVAVGAALKVSIDAYEAQRAAEIKLENALKNNPRIVDKSTDSFLRQASALQRVTVAGDDQIISAQAMLATFRLSNEELTALTPLVVDYARRYEIDLVSAAKAVGKAMMGNRGALQKQGVILDENKFAADRFNAVLTGLRENAGGFARAEGKTLTGQLMILKNQFGEFAEEIGAQAVPALLSLLKVATTTGNVIGDVNSALDSVGVDNTVKFAALGAVIPGVGIGMGAAAGAAVDMRNAFRKGLDVDAMAEAAIKAAGAQKDMGNETKKAASEFKEQQIQVLKAKDAVTAFFGGAVNLSQAQTTVTERLDEYNRVMADGTSTAAQRQNAEDSLKESYLSVSKAIEANADANMNGTVSAEEQKAATDAQIASLQGMANGLAPGSPVRTFLEQYIMQLRAASGDFVARMILQSPSNFREAFGQAQVNFGLGWVSVTNQGGRLVAGARAHGGPVSAGGAYLVGERGPELLQMGSMGGNVVPNHALGGGGNVYVTVNAPVGSDAASIGRSLQEYLDVYRRRAGLN